MSTSNDVLTLSLRNYVDTLRHIRDEHATLFKTYGFEDDHGRAAAYANALSWLHAATGGQFGERGDGPSTVTLPPVSAPADRP